MLVTQEQRAVIDCNRAAAVPLVTLIVSISVEGYRCSYVAANSVILLLRCRFIGGSI